MNASRQDIRRRIWLNLALITLVTLTAGCTREQLSNPFAPGASFTGAEFAAAGDGFVIDDDPTIGGDPAPIVGGSLTGNRSAQGRKPPKKQHKK